MIARLVVVAASALLAAASEARGAELKGIIVENEVSGPPIADVEVTAKGANRNVTLGDGKFTFIFPNKRAGETVRVEVAKEGYTVVNSLEIDAVVLPADASSAPVVVLVCRGELAREEMALRYYKLKSVAAIDARYRKLLSQSSADRARLERDRDQAKLEADNIARELARVEPGAGLELYNSAMRLFLQGKVDEALNELTSERIKKELKAAKEAAIRLTEEKSAETWLLRAQMQVVNFKFDDADKTYREAMKELPDVATLGCSFAQFNHVLKRYPAADSAYQQCLDRVTKDGDLYNQIKTRNNIGVLRLDEGRTDDARMELLKALAAHLQAMAANADIRTSVELLRPLTIDTFNNLGLLEERVNNLDAAANYYNLALKDAEVGARNDLEVFMPRSVSALINHGNVLQKAGRREEALKAYKEAEKDLTKLAKHDEGTWLPLIARNQINLGVLYGDMGKDKEALVTLDAAVESCRNLIKTNRESYSPVLAAALNDLGTYYGSRGDAVKARKALEESRKIREDLAKKNPGVYRKDLAQTLHNFGRLDEVEKRFADAEHSYKDALEIYRDLAKKEPSIYEPSIAIVKDTLGNMYVGQHRFAEACAAFEEALATRRTLASKNPQTFLPDVAASLFHLAGGYVHNPNGQEDARRAFFESLVLYRGLAGDKQQGHLQEMAAVLYAYGLFSASQKRFDEADRELGESLQLRRELAKTAADTYLPDVARTLSMLGMVYRDEKKTKDAGRAFKESFSLYKKLASHDPKQFQPEVERVKATMH